MIEPAIPCSKSTNYENKIAEVEIPSQKEKPSATLPGTEINVNFTLKFLILLLILLFAAEAVPFSFLSVQNYPSPGPSRLASGHKETNTSVGVTGEPSIDSSNALTGSSLDKGIRSSNLQQSFSIHNAGSSNLGDNDPLCLGKAILNSAFSAILSYYLFFCFTAKH